MFYEYLQLMIDALHGRDVIQYSSRSIWRKDNLLW